MRLGGSRAPGSSECAMGKLPRTGPNIPKADTSGVNVLSCGSDCGTAFTDRATLLTMPFHVPPLLENRVQEARQGLVGHAG